MSAAPTRSDWQASGEAALPVDQGVRVLASIGNQEGLRALLAFSDLHEKVLDRRLAGGVPADPSLLKTERFILQEVLQLICARALALTQADGVLLALQEGPELVCRASAGSTAIPQGMRLTKESEFLRSCLESGKTQRCDDLEGDARMQFDFARQLGARSTVVVPLCGRRERIGVLQAFAASPWAFTDQDIRCFDLFAELVLAALKPPDQDRRLHWLSDVACELLQPKALQPEPLQPEPLEPKPLAAEPLPVVPAAVEASAAEVVRTGVGKTEEAAPPPAIEPVPVEPIRIEPISIEPVSAQAETGMIAALDIAPADIAPAPAAHAITELTTTAEAGAVSKTESETAPVAVPIESMPIEPALVESTPTETAKPFELAPAALDAASGIKPEMPPTTGQAVSTPASAVTSPAADELAALAAPVVIPVAMFELPGPELEDVELPTYLTFEKEQGGTPPTVDTAPKPARGPLFLHKLVLPLTSRPGLSVVLMLVMVAGLFSAGVWWGMQAHSGAPDRMVATQKSITAPGAPAALAPAVTDNLTLPIPQEQPQPAITDDKLAALPKITGVRHWSSSMGSTVVIDLQDQVNYEVHRLMSPERIYFDLHDTALPPELDGKTMDVGDTSLSRVRVAQPIAGVTRVVLDTKDGSNFSVSMETNPYRLVVELRDTPKPAASSHLVAAAPQPKPATAAPLASASTPSPQPLAPRTGKFRIVLDPGHGGWDLGTVGRQGLLEKDLVLDVARRLGKLLQTRMGADVLFTRTGDDYLALDQRADFANQAQADLFVSVHANYSNSATARGVETYYTNLFSAPGSKEIEKHPDGTFTPPSVVSLSADGLHEKIEESRRLAASVQRALYGALAPNSPDIRDRGIKDASFVVLTGTIMPSILTEISFVSSPADEQNLQSAMYRQQIAEALYKGIARYQESSPKNKVAQLRPAATGR